MFNNMKDFFRLLCAFSWRLQNNWKLFIQPVKVTNSFQTTHFYIKGLLARQILKPIPRRPVSSYHILTTIWQCIFKVKLDSSRFLYVWMLPNSYIGKTLQLQARLFGFCNKFVRNKPISGCVRMWLATACWRQVCCKLSTDLLQVDCQNLLSTD